MKLPTAVIFTGLAAIAPLTAAAPQPPAAPAPPQPAKTLAQWVADLSNENYRAREEASREIWKLGETALPELTQAVASGDPETAFRARELLRKIQLHITPDTDPSVIVLVERYLKASVTEKGALLGKMKLKRAWRQMLKLYAAETSAEAREKLREAVEGVAVAAARESIAKGNDALAKEFLEMAPADSAGLLALAEFHRSHGTLAAELHRAKSAKGPKAAAWQLALLRASGDLQGASEAALATGDAKVAAAMSALAGDPLPWFREAGDDPNPVTSAYTTVVTKRWLGKKVRPDDLEPILKAMAMRRDNDRGPAMNALFLLGETGAVEPTFARSEPLSAFLYFQALERIPEALAVMGIEFEKPDYKAWVEKRMTKLTGEDVEDQHGATSHSEELVAVANFLERKGLHDEAFAAFSGPIAALAEKDEDAFQEFLGNLFGNRRAQTGAPLLAKRIGMEWAAKKEANWNDLVALSMGDEDMGEEWWKWLEEIAPQTPAAERFDGMMAIFDLGPDPGGLRKQWLDRAWKAVEGAPEGERGVLASRMSRLGTFTGDVPNALRAWDLMPEDARKSVSVDRRFYQLTAAGRWNDAVELIFKQMKMAEGRDGEPRAELHAYAAASLRKAGRAAEAVTHDEWADKLALGDVMMSIRVGNIYANGGDFKRAGDWWSRAAREADPDGEGGEFSFALKVYSDGLLEEGRWKECASISEVIARTYAVSDVSWTEPLTFTRHRLQADMARALANLKNNRAESIAVLDKAHHMFAKDGSLADFFFPSVRKMGLVEKHDEWFEESWREMQEVIRLYPDSDNTCNTAAWLASRAMRRLDEAEKLLAGALTANPGQPAYLDTMAEIQFARGNREKAMEWSRIAVNSDPEDLQLRRQQERFRTEPLPK